MRRPVIWIVFAMSALAACWPGRLVSNDNPIATARHGGAPVLAVANTMLPEARREPRVTLTASDGTGLQLQRVAARAVVDEPLALTEIAMAFENPLDRTLEGTFRFTLPPGAAISRFAMKVRGEWQEGEVVEKQRARRTYEDFLHKKQDPALLEQAAGTEFSARVFPIPAHATKEIVIAYSEEVAPGRSYVLPLAGLPELGALDVAVHRAGSTKPTVATHEEHVVPRDVILPDAPSTVTGVASGDLVLLRLRPDVSNTADPLDSTLVLLDTSGSRALGLADELRALARLVDGVVESSGPEARLAVVCFDQSTETVFDGSAGAFGREELARIEARGALGASNVEAALFEAKKLATARGYTRVLVMSDGVATAGAAKDEELVSATRALREAGVSRLDAVVLGGIRDEGTLRRMVTAGLAHDGLVADAGLDPSVLLRKLTLSTRSGMTVNVRGARWWWPKTLDGVQAGEARSVYAEMAVGDSSRARIEVDGKASDVVLRDVARPLLERSWAQAKITSLLDDAANRGAGPDVTERVVSLSVGHRVLSPYTAMVVLETDSDYERFHLDRKGLADILVIDDGHIAVARRADPTKREDAPLRPGPRRAVHDADAADSFGLTGLATLSSTSSAAQASASPNDTASGRGNMWGEAMGDAAGGGGLGLAGMGEGGGGAGEGIGLGSIGSLGAGAGTGSATGFGAGHGRLGGSHAASAPVVRMGATQVNGRIPPEVIQRIVRQNYGRFRLCYEAGLRRDATLRGRVTVRFAIDRSGAVSQVGDGGSDMGDPDVVACVVRAFTSLAFPEPEGGIVTVVYPISFSPDGTTEGAASDPGPPATRPPATARPYGGRFRQVMDELEAGDARKAVALATEWHASDPGDVLALIAMGQALETTGDRDTAGRAYGSLIDLFPARADLRRFAGERLEHLADGAGLGLALDTFAKAKEERPDHPSSHRLLAFAFLKRGAPAQAFEALVEGLHQRYPEGRFAGVQKVMREDLGLVGAAWIRSDPKRRPEIERRIVEEGGTLERGPSLRFVLNWETDGNDVDFHVYDAMGNHAYYANPSLPSGGHLYADVTTGYGPECFTIREARAKRAGPYTLQANYYARGPMGYGMGKLEVIDHDGEGNLTFAEHPYVVMTDHAFVDLGKAL